MLKKHALPKIIFSLILLFDFHLVFAAIPPTLNYQGHLTNNAGAPTNGLLNMTFKIYDVNTGGIALWSETRSVTVNQGVFSIELGESASPLPLGLFENTLWIGLSVDADAEMTPRRPVTSSGFSFKAGDADTLEGISAATLDQSAHVTDTANPHSVTAAQVGAADAGTLTSHISNISNPHDVTASQTGAASSSDFTSHTSDSAAHHLRYTDAEAISSMGIKSDANALNHDRYTDGNAVAAMLAADGAGSTLDADMVDGLQVSEIIDAAQDEVRTPISSLPVTINQPGSYYLTGNLDGSGGGITVTADDVTLDLMGFTIDGGGTGVTSYGILLDGSNNAAIRNGTIKGFGWGGIYQGATSVRYTRVMDITTINNGSLSTGSYYSGIYLLGLHSHVERCTSGDNGGYGIYAYIGSRLINNTAYSNGGTYGIVGNASSILSGNTVYNHFGSSYAIYGSTSTKLTENSANYNHGTGGIYGGAGAILSGNSARNNDGIGIYGSTGASLIGNNANINKGWGIYGFNSNLIKDNTLYYNNSTGSSGEGGLRAGSDSRVSGNFLDGNLQYDIYVTGSDNTLENNHTSNSLYGIYFVTTDNFYADNRASGNTTANYFNAAGQTNGGGNYSF